MNTQYMKVNPNELVIDLPVDEAHVVELMESIERVGRLIEPPTIWLGGMRIINGFHRVIACQRLGWSEIDCLVDDCTEEAFWDARIIAAKPHTSISNARLAVWIVDSWKASQWYTEVDMESLKRDYEQLGGSSRLDLIPVDNISVAQALWVMDTNEPVKAWFTEKAKKWGINPRSILGAIGFEGLVDPIGGAADRSLIRSIANKTGVSLIEAYAIQPQIKNVRWADLAETENVAVKWVADAKKQKTSLELKDYIRVQKEEENTEFQRKMRDEVRLDEERRKQWRESLSGQAEARKQQLAGLDRQIDSIFKGVESLQIDSFPEAARRLTSLIDLIENRIEESFPDLAQKTKVNPIIAENIELRRQAEEQKRKIESLERALNSKQGSTKMLPKTQAFSSIEIEAMA